MQQYDDLDAIHIVSHGDVGELSLGSTKLNKNTLNSYANGLITWRDFIADNGDILLYGCSIAESAVGEEFVEDLSQYTAADILASVDLTGSEDLGGDWDLEFAIGDIEEDLAFDAEIKSSYQHTLVDAEFTVISTRPDDGFNDRFNDRFNDQIDRELSGSRDDDQVDASDYSSFANVPADNLVNLARNGLNFAEVSPETLATIDFNNIPAEDFQILKDAGLSLIPLSFEALSNVNLGVVKNFDYLSQIDLSQTRFNNLTVFGQLSSTFAINANLYDYKAVLDIDSGLNLDKIAQLSLSDFKAIDYAFDGDEIFDNFHYTNLRKTLNGANPYTDYVENGWKLGLDPHPLFDTSYYLARNTDVINAGAEPLKHYITTGYSELNPNRDPHPLFDTSYYQDSNTDIVNANKNPLLHYLENGLTENFDSRDPNPLFDSSYYNAKNPDVVKEGMNPLVHYLQHGWKESRIDNPGGFNPNRDPSPFFDTSYYFDKNIDVLQASYLLDSANPVQHYLEFGNFGLYANEDRTTYRGSESENIVRITRRYSPDSDPEEISNLKESFKANRYDLETKDGNFEISQIDLDPVIEGGKKLLGGIAAYAFYTGVKIIDAAGNAFIELTQNLEDRFDPADDTVTFSGYTTIPLNTTPTDAVTIDYGDPSLSDLLGTRPFPGQTENQIAVEIFTTPEIDGIEDFTIFPDDSGIFLPTTTEFPLRDETLEAILNGGIFTLPVEEENFPGFYTINTDPFAAVDVKIDLDLGTFRELKVAEITGGFKVVTPGRPKKDLVVQVPNNPSIGLQIDNVGLNNELILTGGPNKADNIGELRTRMSTLKKVADSRGVKAQAYFAEGTPQAAIDVAIEELGSADNVFTFEDVTSEDRSRLPQLKIIKNRIDF